MLFRRYSTLLRTLYICKISAKQCVRLLMMLDLDSQFWCLILTLDFDAWFWRMLLTLDFDTWFWCLILTHDFKTWFKMLTLESFRDWKVLKSKIRAKNNLGWEVRKLLPTYTLKNQQNRKCLLCTSTISYTESMKKGEKSNKFSVYSLT